MEPSQPSYNTFGGPVPSSSAGYYPTPSDQPYNAPSSSYPASYPTYPSSSTPSYPTGPTNSSPAYGTADNCCVDCCGLLCCAACFGLCAACISSD